MLIDTFKSEFKNDTTVSEYGTTAGTLAPSNNPAPIKITNNLMNNVFSGEELAKNIIKNMKKYNIDPSIVGEKNRLRKYLPKKYK